jgi:hypothetical protein
MKNGGQVMTGSAPPKPIQVSIAFDDEEYWVWHNGVITLDGGTPIYSIALHEIGHAIGLSHYNSLPAVMNALLFQRADGGLEFLFMHGSTIKGGASIAGPAGHWHLSGIGDFDGDHKSDMLWRADSGAIELWFMDAGSVRGAASINSVGPEWQLEGWAISTGTARAAWCFGAPTT